ncbi:MAG TPA: hypothetical protein PLN81_13195 [Bacillota bacterium]|nr:hypothetical protein [Bacillota bacterium]
MRKARGEAKSAVPAASPSPPLPVAFASSAYFEVELEQGDGYAR